MFYNEAIALSETDIVEMEGLFLNEGIGIPKFVSGMLKSFKGKSRAQIKRDSQRHAQKLDNDFHKACVAANIDTDEIKRKIVKAGKTEAKRSKIQREGFLFESEIASSDSFWETYKKTYTDIDTSKIPSGAVALVFTIGLQLYVHAILAAFIASPVVVLALMTIIVAPLTEEVMRRYATDNGFGKEYTAVLNVWEIFNFVKTITVQAMEAGGNVISTFISILVVRIVVALGLHSTNQAIMDSNLDSKGKVTDEGFAMTVIIHGLWNGVAVGLTK